jgi:hypothetical protein
MKMIQIHENIPVKARYDVVVCGGGVAGAAAAVSAKRRGRNVLLIEKTNLPGGLATIGLINYFVPMCNGRGKQITAGMAEELLRLSAKHSWNTIPEEWLNGDPETPTETRYTQRYNPQIFALELTEWLAANGVEILFDTLAVRPVMRNGNCDGLLVESKSGREYIETGVVIDATGDADILFRGGVPTVQGKNYYVYQAYEVDLESCQKAYETKNISRIYKPVFAGCANLYGKGQPAEIPLFEGTSGEEISNYLVTSHRRLLKQIEKDDPFTRDIVTLPTMPQFRTTRRLDGDYTLDADDAYKRFSDSVGTICDFDRRDYIYEIPYRCMTKRGFHNLITAGRSVSGSGYAWDVLRVIPSAILTGEAAGVAASIALDSGRAIAEIDIAALQKFMADAGNRICFQN